MMRDDLNRRSNAMQRLRNAGLYVVLWNPNSYTICRRQDQFPVGDTLSTTTATDDGSVSTPNLKPMSIKLKTPIEAALRCVYECVLLRSRAINLGQFPPKRNTQVNT